MANVLRHILIIAITITLLACEHKDLCYHHPHNARVRVDVDWSQFDKETPTGMTLLVFPSINGCITHHSNVTTHAYLDIPADSYNIIVYNQSPSEFGTMTFRGLESYHTAEVVAASIESRWYRSRNEDERIVSAPEWFATDCEEQAIVTPEMVAQYNDEIIIPTRGNSNAYPEFLISEMTPLNIIYTFDIRIHLNGVQNMRSARASITGLAEGYNFSEASPTASIATQLIEAWKLTIDKQDPTKGRIDARITCFGLPKGHTKAPEDNLLTLSLLLVDNKTILDFPFDSGDKIKQRTDENGNPLLELELELGIDNALPDVQPEESGDGGFSAIVDDWGEEENIDMTL